VEMEDWDYKEDAATYLSARKIPERRPPQAIDAGNGQA